jgi:RimJ/RimL family protein N-acetyltransferase
LENIYPDRMELKLRKLREEDRFRLAELANNKKIWDNLRDQMPHPFRLEDADRFIKIKKDQIEDYVFVIEYEGELAGLIGLHPQKDVYRLSLELGYWIGEPFWGKGLATESVKQVLDFAFNNLDINRIFAGALEHNEGSKKVLLKNGFLFEGIARKAVVKNEVIMDEFRYGILRQDYSKLQR